MAGSGGEAPESRGALPPEKSSARLAPAPRAAGEGATARGRGDAAVTRPPPAIGDKMPRGRLARTCGRDSSTSRRGGVGGGGGCGGTGCGGSGRFCAPRAKNERNDKGALLRFARGDAVGEGAVGAALRRGEPRRGEPGFSALSLKKSAHEGESGGGTGATNSATRRTRPSKKSPHSFFLRGSIAKSEFEGAATGDPAATAGGGAAGECARFGKRRGWGEPATAGAAAAAANCGARGNKAPHKEFSACGAAAAGAGEVSRPFSIGGGGAAGDAGASGAGTAGGFLRWKPFTPTPTFVP